MRKVFTLVATCCALAGLLGTACSGGSSQPRESNPHEEFALEIVDVLEEITQAHDVLSDPELLDIPTSDRGGEDLTISISI